MNISFNPSLNHALDLMENTTHNLFITGKAGTGKSTLLSYFRSHTKKNVVVLAPTGVAAINVQGQTIHSFFKFKHTVTLALVKTLKESKEKKNIYKKLNVLIIDEISMVRADLLDCIDKFLRLNGRDREKPFGGVQMVFIGDLYQLPPVVTSQEREIFLTHYRSPYFFSARCFETFPLEFLELDKIFRQQDDRFIHLLNAIRNEMLTDGDMALLNQRVRPHFHEDGYVYLVPKNSEADEINTMRLNALKGKLFKASARIEGSFGREYYPTRQELSFKAGAQVMMVNNDSDGRWVNGTMGKVLGIKGNEKKTIVVRLENGTEVDVAPHTWEINRFFLESEAIQTEAIGSFVQFPLTLAWALTIHKSQGKTFHKVVLDIGSGAFMPGQVYVALSRSTSLEGLVLKKPIYPRHIWNDEEVVRFVKSLTKSLPPTNLVIEEVVERLNASLAEKSSLEIVYMNTLNEKSIRQVTPTYVGPLKHQSHPYVGLRAFCHTSQENKVFRVDRIVGIRP